VQRREFSLLKLSATFTMGSRYLGMTLAGGDVVHLEGEKVSLCRCEFIRLYVYSTFDPLGRLIRVIHGGSLKHAWYTDDLGSAPKESDATVRL